MRDFRDAKAMAHSLREALKSKSVSLTHSESLELIARTFGVHDWNVLAAAIEASRPVVGELGKLPSPAIGGGAELPVAPIRDVVFFPQLMTPIFVGRDKTRRAIEAAIAGGGRLFVVTQRYSGDDDPDFAALYPVGVTADVIQRVTLRDGTMRVKVSCAERAVIARPLAGDFLAAEVRPMHEARATDAEAFTLMREIFDAYQGYTGAAPPQSLYRYAQEPGVLGDVVVQLLELGIERAQRILETSDVVARLETILAWMKAGPPAS